MQSRIVCSENNNQNFVIVHKGKLLSHHSVGLGCSASKTLLLLQEPNESVSIEFSLHYLNLREGDFGREKPGYNFEYSFTLFFHNNLHEMSNDYGYEIDFYQHVQHGMLSSHTRLFSHKQIRRTNKFLIKERLSDCKRIRYLEFVDKLVIDTDQRHMCCSIRRYNAKAADRQSTQNINIDATLFYKGDTNSDASLVVRHCEFPVHKAILSMFSNVFKHMFSRDKLQDERGRIIIDDCDPEIIEGLLSFMYIGETSLLSKDPVELFKAAHKYEMHTLVALCEEYFYFIINRENVVGMIEVAIKYGLIELETKLWKFIEKHEEEMVKQKYFQQLLCRNLNIDTVVDTFKICKKYEESLKTVKAKTLTFVKENIKTLFYKREFLEFFDTIVHDL